MGNQPNSILSCTDLSRHIVGFLDAVCQQTLSKTNSSIATFIGHRVVAMQTSLMNTEFIHNLSERNWFARVLVITIDDDCNAMDTQREHGDCFPYVTNIQIQSVHRQSTVPIAWKLFVDWAPRIHFLDIGSIETRDMQIVFAMLRVMGAIKRLRLQWHHVKMVQLRFSCVRKGMELGIVRQPTD